jgi:hypothetical protein
MTVRELAERLGCRTLCVGDPDAQVLGGYTSDLLSDVMANAAEGSVLITIQAHKNTVAVASIAGIRAIILCGDRRAPEEMLAAARDERIAVLQTGDSQFTASHRVALELERS